MHPPTTTGTGRLIRGVRRGVTGLVALVALALAAGWFLVRGSLPVLEGRRVLSGLGAPVVLERDASGVPTLRAGSRVDAARALGFLHAQERFFQMDLLRRRGAGELAALFGAPLVGVDEGARRHGLRRVAEEAVRRLSASHRAVLEAYRDGVNAGLAALTVRPPEYLLLRASPEPWLAEDSFLVAHAMYFDLQDADGHEDRRRGAVRRALPPGAAEFFFPAASEWDAALDGTQLSPAPVPGPEVLDFRGGPPPPPRAEAAPRERPVDGREWADRWAGAVRAWVMSGDQPRPGSNAWAVHGGATTTGAAVVCNDMHLGHALPNVWYRVVLTWPEPGGRTRRVVGASLPGVPVPIVASNGDVAWGFTNATLDNSDVIRVELDPADASRYRTPDGFRAFEERIETLRVRGEPARTVRFRRTVWGPVIGEDGPGVLLAVRWTAHSPESVNLGLLDLESATTVEAALAAAAGCGVPVQNLLVGDRDGNLAYTLIGRLPRRIGYEGSVPVSMADGRARWEGWVPDAERPVYRAPAGARLWTANNRILGTPEYLALGCLETDPGARARQIRDGLAALKAPVSEASLLTLYRDDRALFLDRWRQRMLQTLAAEEAAASPGSGTEARRFLTEAVRDWGGRAATHSVGYRMVRAFRWMVHSRLMAPVTERCESVGPGIGYGSDRHEAPVWALLEARPAHLLNPKFDSYEALLADALRGVEADLARQNIPVREATWGARNTLRIRHPLTRAVPALGRWLNLEPRQVPGDDHMTKVQGTEFGPSERLIVSPGHEESGVFQMPGGQSGHFLSPYYRAGHADWVEVRPSPLLPGPTRYRLDLVPDSGR